MQRYEFDVGKKGGAREARDASDESDVLDLVVVVDDQISSRRVSG
jgi:hypothetical protein